MQAGDAPLITLLLLYTATVIGGVAWLHSQFSKNRTVTFDSGKEIKKEFAKAIRTLDRRIIKLEHWRISKDGLAVRGHSDDLDDEHDDDGGDAAA